MKTPSAKAKVKAFTLVELLAVIFILVGLAIIFLPFVGSRPRPAYQTVCMNNQKQIAIGFIMWRDDNVGQFPWQISSINGGTMEAAARGYAAPNFQILSNYFSKRPDIFVCPTDQTRKVVPSLMDFKNRNLSYFVAFGGGTNATVNILTGDRHLERNGNPVMPGLFIFSTNTAMNWTHELHGNVKNSTWGCLSFADGHCESMRGVNLNEVFQRENLKTNRLCVP